MNPDHYDKNDIAQELAELRRIVIATDRRWLRKKQNVSILNNMNYDFGEEAVRLDWHQPDFRALREDIARARKDVASGVVSGESALQLLADLAEHTKEAVDELDDIQVPHMSRVWAEEDRKAY